MTENTTDELTDEQAKAMLRDTLNSVGVQYDGVTPLAQLPLIDWMKFHLSHMWSDLRDDGEAQNQAVLIGADGTAIMVNMHFCEPKLSPMALLTQIAHHKCTRALFMAEVWAADDTRTDAEREAGVAPPRAPREREDRRELLVCYGWEWGSKEQAALEWPIDRTPDGKPVMVGLPRAVQSKYGPLSLVTEVLYAVAQNQKTN